MLILGICPNIRKILTQVFLLVCFLASRRAIKKFKIFYLFRAQHFLQLAFFTSSSQKQKNKNKNKRKGEQLQVLCLLLCVKFIQASNISFFFRNINLYYHNKLQSFFPVSYSVFIFNIFVIKTGDLIQKRIIGKNEVSLQVQRLNLSYL